MHIISDGLRLKHPFTPKIFVRTFHCDGSVCCGASAFSSEEFLEQFKYKWFYTSAAHTDVHRHTHTHRNQTSAWRTFAVVKVRRDNARPIPCDLYEAHEMCFFFLILPSHSSKGLDEVDWIVFAFQFNVLNLFPVQPLIHFGTMNYEEAYNNYNENSYPHIPENSIVFRFSSFALFAFTGGFWKMNE